MMAQAYTPGLQIKERTRYRAQRLLPISGDVLVQVGDVVRADQIVARTEQPGNLYPLNVANLLSIVPADVPACMLKQVGDKVASGEPLAISRGIFGMFRQTAFASADAVVESISEVTGQVILRGAALPVQVDAFVSGKVVEVLPGEGVVVETTAAFLQGIFGVGGEQQGALQVVTEHPDQDFEPQLLQPGYAGQIIVGGGRLHGATVRRAQELGVHALIAGGIDDQELKEILGYDLGVAITGSEKIGLTIIITEGFGQIAMAGRTFSLLRSLQGKAASVNGATQIRAGVMRPEIVIPLPGEVDVADTAAKVGGGILRIGSHVRLIRDPYFGELGVVASLPSEPQLLASGSKARVLQVKCSSGKEVIVPRANVELVGD
ncbi:hypothetical protein [Planctomicrobium sp. SH664]|uniref:hypothetical protein n=1 Tax=Planctomicrobium sp. SH664 TaxID=3448125 RepID=UPI003F5C4F69